MKKNITGITSFGIDKHTSLVYTGNIAVSSQWPLATPIGGIVRLVLRIKTQLTVLYCFICPLQ